MKYKISYTITSVQPNDNILLQACLKWRSLINDMLLRAFRGMEIAHEPTIIENPLAQRNRFQVEFKIQLEDFDKSRAWGYTENSVAGDGYFAFYREMFISYMQNIDTIVDGKVVNKGLLTVAITIYDSPKNGGLIIRSTQETCPIEDILEILQKRNDDRIAAKAAQEALELKEILKRKALIDIPEPTFREHLHNLATRDKSVKKDTVVERTKSPFTLSQRLGRDF